jgi:hypothetical protein
MMEEFLAFSRGEEPFDLSRFIPWGDENGWSTHRVGHEMKVGELHPWGMDEDRAGVDINFSSRWTPPLPVILKASALFPELEFEIRYFERGVGFNGMFICKAGEVSCDESGPYFGWRGG